MNQNINIRKFFQNFSSLLTGKTLGDFFSFLFFIMIAREFGQEGIGQYSFAMAFTSFIVVFTDFGFYNLSIKEMSRHPDAAIEYFGKIIFIRIFLSITVLALFFIMLPFLRFPTEMIIILAILGCYQICNTLVDGLTTVFIAKEDMHLAGIVEASLRLVSALLGIIFIKLAFSLTIALCVLPVVSFIYIIISYFQTNL